MEHRRVDIRLHNNVLRNSIDRIHGLHGNGTQRKISRWCDSGFWATRNFGLTNFVLFIFGMGMFGSVFLIPVYLQNILGYTALQSGMVLLPMGIIQAVTGPIAGYFSDKINPKILILVPGIALFSPSFFFNTRLSIFSENAQIMFPMYLRGVAMGMLFSPLSALAMTEISRNEMAQASGLTNVIRQVGGSFGVAILQTILTQRILFHTAVSGAGLDSASPVFTQSRQLLQMHAIHDAGSTVANAAAQSTGLLLSHFSQQMFVYAINDDFFIACMCTLACAVPILILKRNKNRKMI